MYITAPLVNNSIYFYYCTHGCVCQLEENGGGGGGADGWVCEGLAHSQPTSGSVERRE